MAGRLDCCCPKIQPTDSNWHTDPHMNVAHWTLNTKALVIVAALIAPGVCIATGPQAPSNEARTDRYFQSIRKDPTQLLVFLREMPKGGDLHNHLLGAIYAESFIQWAAEDGLCVNSQTLYLTPPPCESEKGTVPASTALSDRFLYRQMIDAFSMRNWQLSGESGHDHFFDTFDKFIVAGYGNTGKMLAETAARAASQHEVYQELMHAAAIQEISALVSRTGWDDDFSHQREKLLAGGMAQVVTAARKEMDDAESSRDSSLRCVTTQPDPGCKITQRYLYMVLRGLPKQFVFGQMVLGFELASIDSRFVGINLVCRRTGTFRCTISGYTCVCCNTCTACIPKCILHYMRANWRQAWLHRRT